MKTCQELYDEYQDPDLAPARKAEIEQAWRDQHCTRELEIELSGPHGPPPPPPGG